MTFAEEFERRAFLIADRSTQWVAHTPSHNESCTVITELRSSGDLDLSFEAQTFIEDNLLGGEDGADQYRDTCWNGLLNPDGELSLFLWNDTIGRKRRQVVELLLEASALAKAMSL